MPEETTNLTVRLPKKLYDQLAQAAGQRGMSGRVRQLLEAGLQAEAPVTGDEKTGELLRFVAAAAKAINDSYDRPWHQSWFLTEALRLAVEQAIREVGVNEPEAGPHEPPKPGTIIERMSRHPAIRDRDLNAKGVAELLGWLWLQNLGVRL